LLEKFSLFNSDGQAGHIIMHGRSKVKREPSAPGSTNGEHFFSDVKPEALSSPSLPADRTKRAGNGHLFSS